VLYAGQRQQFLNSKPRAQGVSLNDHRNEKLLTELADRPHLKDTHVFGADVDSLVRFLYSLEAAARASYHSAPSRTDILVGLN
jgi:hypothetical protein